MTRQAMFVWFPDWSEKNAMEEITVGKAPVYFKYQTRFGFYRFVH